MKSYSLLIISIVIEGVFPVAILIAANGDQSQVSDRSQQEQVTGSGIWLESKEIDLGIIAPEQTTIVGAIHFMNEGSQPPAIRAAGGVLPLFYEDIYPRVIFLTPSQAAFSSGLKEGIHIKLTAYSYNGHSHISDIVLDFSILNETGPWSSITTLQGEPDNLYEYFWINTINDDQVWIRVQSYDTGGCDSITNKRWIRIDSTPPTIKNTSY